MPDINQMPVSVEEFMYPKSDQSASDSASEGELSYSNYYSMLSNIPNVPMATAMANYNPTVHMPNGVTEGESKEKENTSPNQNHNGK